MSRLFPTILSAALLTACGPTAYDPAIHGSFDDGVSDDDDTELSDTGGLSDDDSAEGSQTPPADDPPEPVHCSETLVPTGHGVGQVAHDFTLTDQSGQSFRLYDHCDKTVLLVGSAMWCAPCQDEAPMLGALFDQYASDGLVVVTLLGENLYGGPPGSSDLNQWSSSFGLHHPVVAEPGWQVGDRFEVDGYIPTISLIGPGAVVLARDEGYAADLVPANLP